jgi:hypothetical protein
MPNNKGKTKGKGKSKGKSKSKAGAGNAHDADGKRAVLPPCASVRLLTLAR